MLNLIAEDYHQHFSMRLESKNLKSCFGLLVKKKKKTLQKFILYGIFGFIYFSQIVSGLVTRKLVPKSFLLGESFTIIILAMLHSMWDFSSLTRDQTCVPCNPAVDVQSPNHWTTWEFP